MNSYKKKMKKMKLIGVKTGVMMLAFCLMVIGSVFLGVGAFGRNNRAAAEETNPEWITLKEDADWATLQEKLFEGGYYKLGKDFVDNSASSGKAGTTVDYKGIFNIEKYATQENPVYPFYKGCGPLLIVKNTTIDLCGFSIDRNRTDGFHSYGMVFWIKNGATLTIIDSSEGNGEIKGGRNKGSADNQNNAPKIDQKRVNDYFDDELRANEIDVENPISLPYSYQITYGGAFYVENGTLNLQAGNVHVNSDSLMDGPKGIGAGVYIGENGTFIMGGKAIIQDNTANANNNGDGNTLYADENAVVEIEDISKVKGKNGKQSVIKVALELTITGNINTTQYDGIEHTVSGFEVSSNLSDNMFESSWVTYNSGTPSAMQKVVGTNSMGLKKSDFSVIPGEIEGVEYSSVSIISIIDGYQEITNNEKPIEITSSTKDWIYDGQTHMDETYTVTYGGSDVPADDSTGKVFTLPTGDTITITATAEGVKDYDAGYSENNIFTYDLTNADCYSNVSATAGTLSITKRDVTLTSESGEKVYDGTPLTKPDVTVGGDGFVDGEVTDIKAAGSVTTVAEGEVTNTITYTKNSSFKADNYTITKNEGKLKITASTKAIVITSSTKSWTYDGQTHTDEIYSVTYGGSDVPADDSTGKIFTLSTGDTITITATAEGVKYYDAGYSENNTFTYVLTNAGSYSNVTASAGTLSIDKCLVTIKADNKTKEYDNVATTDPKLTATVTGVPAKGVAPVYTLSRAAGQNANDYAISVTAEAALNPNYDVTVEPGVFSISKCPVTIKADDITKVYDNDSATDPQLKATVTGVPENGVAPVYTLSRAQGQSVGEYAISVTLGDNSNYDVTVEAGMFSISKCLVTIKADNKTKVYDNDAATDPKLTATVTGVVSGDTINYTLSRAEGQNVGEYAITVTSGNNPNYDVTVEAGTFSITAKEVALTWSDTEFPYDGKSHAPVATVSNLADGDTCEVTVDGAQTKIGDAYTANATALSNPNYKLPSDASTKFKIYGCTITFVDEDGTELQSGVVEYGTKPSYTGKTPVKAATAQYSYEFLDWSPTITEVTGDKTYTATYKPILNAYTVTWKDEDGTILETDKDVPYGTVPTYDGKEPTKAATAEYSFKFDGWSIKVSEVTGDITYTATYAKSAIEYTVEAENLPEGTQLSFSGKETVEAGKILTFKVLLADGYEASDDLVVTVNGTKLVPNADGSYTIPSVMTNSVISVTGVVKVDYNLTEGDNAEYQLGASQNAKFIFKRTVNDKVTFGRFTYAELDGKVLDPNNYTKTSGSLILELKKDYLDTLSVGEHLLKVYFSDDTEGVIAHFLISAGITPTVTVTVTPAPDSNPTTGDTSNPILWVLLIGAAVLGLIGMVYSRSRMER